MNSRSCSSIVRVHYLVHLLDSYSCSLRAGILFLRVLREMNWQAIIRHIAFALLLFIRDLVTFPTLFPSQLNGLGSIDFTLL